MNIKNKKGFSLMELLVVISFVSAIVILIISVTSLNTKIWKTNEEKTQALFYATEGIEAIKTLDWDDLSPGDYSVSVASSSWSLSSGSQTINDKYTRTITVSNVYRENMSHGHAYGNIAQTGYFDPETKKITVNIDWTNHSGRAEQEQLETYLHNFGAERWSQTDWSGGSGQSIWLDETMFDNRNVGIDVTTPGIATLQLGYINWSQTTTTATFDTPGNFDDNDVYQKDGVAYLVTEKNPSAQELYILDVSDISNPVELSRLEIGESVSSLSLEGDYLYLSTFDNYGELKVVDVDDLNNPQIIYSYDLPSNDNALDVVTNQNELYIIQGSYIYSFSISNPESPQFLDSLDAGNLLNEAFLSEDYVYLASLDDLNEFKIIDVTNPANMSIASQYNLAGSLKGTDIYVRGNTAFISTQNNGSGGEFFLFDITDPYNPTIMGEHNVDETVYSFSVIGPYALLGTNFLEEELVILDITYPDSIVKIFGFNLDGYVLGMSANCSVIYAATSGNLGEFFIVSTEVMDCDYSTAGYLESSTYDTGSSKVTYNWIAWNGDEPLNTSIRFQLATSNSDGGPWFYVGPDGTSSSYYTLGAQELINYNYHSDQRYIRYKFFMDSYADLETPTLEDITISYTTYP